MEAGMNRDGSITAAMPPSLSIPAQVPLNRRMLRVPTRVLIPEMQAFFGSEEGQREFAAWKAQQNDNKTK